MAPRGTRTRGRTSLRHPAAVCAVECCLAGALAWELGLALRLPAFAVSAGRLPACGAGTTGALGDARPELVGAAELRARAPVVTDRRVQTPATFAAGGAATLVALLVLGVRRRQHWQLRATTVRTRLRGLKTGMVGLPNVGKSTLFNALCENGKADAQNFPFCTIEPNVARATVPDLRLHQLAEKAKSEKVIPEQIEYVDIAGLVKGASKGEGLGNKFLSNIREVDAIVHVVRCFENDDITHVDGSVDPVRDIETINLELIFSDIDQIERRLVKVERDIKGKVDGAVAEKEALLKLQAVLEEGKPARLVELTEKEENAVKNLGLLTKKSVIYAANVSEEDLAEGNELSAKVQKVAEEFGDKACVVSAQVEAELCGLSPEEQAEFLETLGVEESGCKSLIRDTYSLLGLRTYFTVGPKESRAWTIRAGWTAPQAAGVIHTDFQKGFIKAATISYSQMLECDCSEDIAKEKGLLRIEGKEYVVQEGDVMHFRFN